MSDPRAERYLAAVRDRLAADGCDLRDERWNGWPVLVGRRSDFRMRWMATRLHQFACVTVLPEISRSAVEQYTTQALRYAVDNKSGMPRGFQTGVALFPAMISDRVDPDALAWAEAQQRLQFAVMARPVVVDVARGVVAAFRGRAKLGAVYNGHLRAKSIAYFPPVAEVVAVP
jgi:hypothetical protein